MSQLVSIADRLVRAAAVVLMLALLISVTLGVLSRQINQPLSWTDELAQYLLVWTGFAGWMIATRRHAHIRITMFADRLPGAPRILLELLIQAALALFGAALVWYSFRLIQRNLDVESISVPFPAAALYVPLPFLGLTLILQAAADAMVALRGKVDTTGGQAL